MWVQGEWADSGDTVEGRARLVTLSDPDLGIIAKLDLTEGDGAHVTPVDYKRGKRPHVARHAHTPERVQISAQILLLRAQGYTADEGVIYFAGSRERVTIPYDTDLAHETEQAIHRLRLLAASGHIPPSLDDSPKCVRCSLNSICLPDEVTWLREADQTPRPLATARAEALPLIVQTNGARISKFGETLTITTRDESDTEHRTSTRIAGTRPTRFMAL